MQTVPKAFVFVLLSFPLFCSGNQEIARLEYEGTQLRLRGDYESAKSIEEKLLRQFAEPAGHAFALNTIITHLTWDETITRYDDDLLRHAEKTLFWCNNRLDRNPADSKAHYYCGQANFSLSLLHGVRGEYYRAGRHGTLCIDHLEAALESDPTLVDAKTYLGLSYYVADNLPPFIKLFSRVLWFIPTGNSEKSLPYLKDVIDNGYQYQDVARYIYSVLLLEGSASQKAEAEVELQYLVDHYPGNSRFQLRLISLLLIQGDFERTLHVADAYLDHEALEPPPEPDLSLVKVWMARAHLELQQIEEANRLFRETETVFAATGETLPGWSVAWHLLNGGQLHDLANRRREAKESYAAILNVSKSTFVHHTIIDAARRGLLAPYTVSP